jgi:hypothetical protein
MIQRRSLNLAVLAFLVGTINPAAAQEQTSEETVEEKSFWSQFKDPDDGMLDMSQFLLENSVGFLPVPIIITEPAVENGLGLAGIFFHQTKEDQMIADSSGNLILPNISAIAAVYTGNESWVVGGGHFRNWSKDRFRYNLMAGYADINLDWYGGGDDLPIPDDGVLFNAQGAMLDQEFLFRLGASDWFLGTSWSYLKSDVTFKTSLPIELPTVEDSVSGLSAVALYENLDSQMSPRKGFRSELKAEVNREAIGSDYHYEEYSWEIRQYFEFAEKYTLSWRLDGAATSGDVPFYLEPFVEIQGIPAVRYQGATAATIEVRGGYDLRPRWTILGFVGGGRAAATISDLGSATTRTAYGAGFRYLMAKALGMRVGIDVARGPEGTYIYLVMGSAW